MQVGTKGAELVKFFFALSEPIRLEIVRTLLSAKELCVCQITQAFGLSQPKVSFHMRMLREADLVLWERRGRWVYYRLNLENPMLRAVLPFIEEGMEVSKIQKIACEVEP
jgi:ArsR family transcriptional regulator